LSAEHKTPYPTLPHGIHAKLEKNVPANWTLAAFDPELPPVLSTPAMIGMMESAAASAAKPHLSDGIITVGTRIEVDHLKAVTTGATIEVSARLTAQEGRFLTFEVEARSGSHVIGRGKVFRAIVEPRSFQTRATARGNS
jgi:fluoroacetyl-CoA thioesterase